MDFVYLKNILLQFLEQKDKKLQMQLVPVLGMLLHFDRYHILDQLAIWLTIIRKEEQKWMAAVSAIPGK